MEDEDLLVMGRQIEKREWDWISEVSGLCMETGL